MSVPPGRPPEPRREGLGGGIDVSVLVPVRNEAAVIRDTAEAMLAQRFEGRVEFLFVDGDSADGTGAILAELARRDDRVRLLRNPARRIPNALNIGLRAASGEFVARMDAHTWYPPDYLARGVERLRRGGVDWVAGPQIPSGGGGWSGRVALALESGLGRGESRKWGTGVRGAPFRGPEFELDTGVFAGVWRRTTLERQGGWDESWPINEDSELAARVLGAGGRIVCLPELGARYRPRDSLRALARQYARYGYYRLKTARRHPETLRWSHLGSAALALAAVSGTLGGGRVRSLARAGLASYAASLAAVSAEAGRKTGRADAATLPLVFATMHLAWGFGYLAGCLRWGPPLRAVVRNLRTRLRA